MAKPITAPANMAPQPPKGQSDEQKIAMWADLVDACDQLLLAGLRHQVGPDGDVEAAYRRWYSRRMEEHDRVLFRMLERLSQAEEARCRPK